MDGRSNAEFNERLAASGPATRSKDREDWGEEERGRRNKHKRPTQLDVRPGRQQSRCWRLKVKKGIGEEKREEGREEK